MKLPDKLEKRFAVLLTKSSMYQTVAVWPSGHWQPICEWHGSMPCWARHRGDLVWGLSPFLCQLHCWFCYLSGMAPCARQSLVWLHEACIWVATLNQAYLSCTWRPLSPFSHLLFMLLPDYSGRALAECWENCAACCKQQSTASISRQLSEL